ncbi:hypothetical protein JTE90_018199 [Oedothorax gibbosus]|uniref:Uncharacterized protein n=1 Tax=Oedothorax gibbosus TaxID=931172 RepID=A0AAV6U9A7_9ARAC|nr:hypothetical protein JTE90_018199 [Oedothorax gibbosus]
MNEEPPNSDQEAYDQAKPLGVIEDNVLAYVAGFLDRSAGYQYKTAIPSRSSETVGRSLHESNHPYGDTEGTGRCFIKRTSFNPPFYGKCWSINLGSYILTYLWTPSVLFTT